MHRLFSIITIALFLVFLCTPPIITFLTPDKEISKTEKRKLTSFPQWGWSPDQIIEFPEKFEMYYDDHFGLREKLVFYQQFFSFKASRPPPLHLSLLVKMAACFTTGILP